MTPGRPPVPSKSEAGKAQNEFHAEFSREVLCKRLLERFFGVFRLARSACDVQKTKKNIGKTMVFHGFSKMAGVRAMSVRRSKKPRKIGPGSLQNASRTPPGPSKIEPGAFQNAKKPTTDAARSVEERKKQPRGAKCGQEAPKSKKWSQHGPNRIAKIEDFRCPGPPLGTKIRYFQQYIRSY